MKQQIVITDLRTETAREIKTGLEKMGYEVLIPPVGCRLWDETELGAFAASCGENLIGVIHPAPPPEQCPLERADEERVAAARDQGPIAAWCVAKTFGGLFRSRGSGALIFLGSIHAEKPVGYGFLFSMGCGAVQMLNREVNQDYGTSGVRSYYVQRGPMHGDPDLRSDISHFYYGTSLRYPEKKLPEPESLTSLLAFLLTPSASILSGADLRADGGMTMFYGERQESIAPPVSFAPSPNPDFQESEQEESRVALVTGSGKGVGAGIARVLSGAGFRCVVNYNTNERLAMETLAGIRQAGGEAVAYRTDVSDPEQVQRMIHFTVEQYGKLDVVVNNAALQYNRFVDQYDRETLSHLWDVNVGGYWRVMKAALPYLRKSPMPRIINVGSVHGKRPTCFDAGYAMTKGGIRMLTREAAIELQPDGIPVNCVSLGGCRIEFKTGNPSFRNRRPAETVNREIRNRDRLVLPEEVGAVVRFLCSEAGAALTGDCIRIDCGQMLK